MKLNIWKEKNASELAIACGIVLATTLAVNTYGTPIDPSTELGIAGPGNWAVLSYGNFSISNPNGYVHGNLGEATGNFTDGGSQGVSGTIYLGSAASGSGLGSDTIVHNSTLPGAALTQAGIAATYYNGLTPNFTAAPSAGGSIPSGVYNISGDWKPTGGTFTLTPGQIYVFNISGDFKPSTGSSPLFITDTPEDVIFNVAGKVAFSGGSSTYPMIAGIILAQDSISLTPGYVNGEIISLNSSINIASEGAVQGTTNVPDGGITLMMLGTGLGLLGLVKRKLIS